MIDPVRYNKRQSNYNAFCRLLDYVASQHPCLLRNHNGNLRSPKEYRNLFDKSLNSKIKST